jgi:hypothetical protein
MKPIAILHLLMTLSAPSFAQPQPLDNALTKNDRANLTVESTNTFLPDRPTGIQQNSSWNEMGTYNANALGVNKLVDNLEIGSWDNSSRPFIEPTIVNGKVYVACEDHLGVFY